MRLFSATWAGDIAWLIPAGLAALCIGLWLARRAARTDLQRAGLILWGGWMLAGAVVFSYAGGIVHQYYTVAIAPAVAALAPIGGVMLWRRRRRPAARAALCATVVGTAAMAFAVLDHSPKWDPWLRYLIVGLAIAGAVGIAAGSLPRRRLVLAAASLGVAAALLGPAAYSVETVTAAGSSVGAAGPAIGGAQFGGGAPASRPGAESARGGSGGGLLGAFGGDLTPEERTALARRIGAFGGFGPGGNRQGGGDRALVSMIKSTTGSYRWVAAMTSAPQAAPIELATGKPVMAIGGFMGRDNAISLSGFQNLVRAGQVRYYIGGAEGPGFGGPRGDGGATTAAGEVASWVQRHYTPRTVGAATVYDLTAPVPSAG